MRKLPCVQVINPETQDILQLLICPLGLIPHNPKDFYEVSQAFAYKNLFPKSRTRAGRESQTLKDVTDQHGYFTALFTYSYLDPVSRKEIEKQGHVICKGLQFVTGVLCVGNFTEEIVKRVDEDTGLIFKDVAIVPGEIIFQPSHVFEELRKQELEVNIPNDPEEIHCGLS